MLFFEFPLNFGPEKWYLMPKLKSLKIDNLFIFCQKNRHGASKRVISVYVLYLYIILGIWNVFSGISFNTNYESVTNLQMEVSSLEELSRQLYIESVDLHNTKQRMIFSTTLQGRYFDFVGHIFSMYCIWKIFISTVNIIFDRVGKTDPVTRTIEISIHYLGFEFDVKFWSQQISFFLVGILIITSIRGLLITLTKFFYALSSSKSSNIIVLVLAEIMGMYFVSCVLLMRMNMPAQYREIISVVLGDLQLIFITDGLMLYS